MEINMTGSKSYSIQINNISFRFLFLQVEQNSDNFIDKTLHTHSHAEIFYCIEDSIQITTSNEKITLQKNDVAIVPYSLRHARIPDFPDNVQWGSIYLMCSLNKNTKITSDNFYTIANSIFCSNKILIFKNNPSLCSSAKKINKSKNIDTLTLLEFIYNFCKSAKEENIEKILISPKNNAKSIDRLLIFDHILNNEYMNSLTNQEVADKLFLSKRQLSRLVTAHYGTSLHKLITKKRLEAIAMQLIETDCSIEELCHKFGFSNKTVFYQQFKKQFGTTPAQYRAANTGATAVKKKT